MGKSDTPLCTFCHIEEEDIEHLFWECHITASFLLDTEQLFFGKQFVLSKRDFFFGVNSFNFHPMNFFILYCKHYIFSCKFDNSKPNCNQFFHKMQFILRVEEYIASKPNTSKRKRKKFDEMKKYFSLVY